MPYGLLGRPTPVPMPDQAYGYDTDASDFIRRVEAADGRALELPVRLALDAFIRGCKADGILNAIKACCILAGARTLSGALVPLVGTAPTSFNFVAADYNRKTGLVGDGNTKYLDSNRNNSADPQNSKHIAVYFGATLASASSANRAHLGIAPVSGQAGASVISTDSTALGATTDSGRYRANGATAAVVINGLAIGLKGASRISASEIIVRQNAATITTSSESEAPMSGNLFVFARNQSGNSDHSNARLSFYSIGEALDLALLDARVTQLMNALAAVL